MYSNQTLNACVVILNLFQDQRTHTNLLRNQPILD